MNLAGAGIVITRPAAAAKRLAERVRAAGGTPIVFPALEIADLEDASAAYARIERLHEFDFAIFISQNAVAKGLALVRGRRAFPPRLKLAAVGAATAAALRQAGFESVIAPSFGGDSVALLAMPQLQAVAGAKVAIFRGVGGKETLRATLLARGASVEYIECYRRRRPDADAAPLVATWRAGAVQAVNVLSVETLNNFAYMIGAEGLALFKTTALAVGHENVAAAAHALGCRDVLVSDGGDEGLLAALASRFARVKTT